jgi:glutamate carboxypeptidase
MDTSMDRLADLRGKTAAMVEDLQSLVQAESFSNDPAGVAACAGVLAAHGERLLGASPDQRGENGRPHLLWRFGSRQRVLLVGHFDTVWPRGTIDRKPFAVDGDRITGPGSFDMKSGIVQGMHALATLSSLDGVALLLTSDEELGSPTSAELIRELAMEADAALILEPSAQGALKTGRKGVSVYSIEITGRAAHAGLEPEKGANALIELAHQVLAISSLADPSKGTSVTPTVAQAGTAINVVPASARIDVDVRVLSIAEQDRIAKAMRELPPRTPGITLTIDADENRPPMEPSSATDLFARAQRLASGLGLPPIEGVTVGGASDGNITAAAGCPTLDGLGAAGDGAHAENEHVVLSEMAPRAALLAVLVEELLSEGRT